MKMMWEGHNAQNVKFHGVTELLIFGNSAIRISAVPQHKRQNSSLN